MRQKKHDRRSLRTRQLVAAAMMELLLEKRYDAITVQDMLNRANVGRSTFYAHYFDKDDVLADITAQMLDSFRMRVVQQNLIEATEADVDHPGSVQYLWQREEAGQMLVPSLELFRHVHQQYPQLRALARGHAGMVLWETGEALLRRNIEQILTSASDQARTAPSSIPVEVVAQYLAGAFLNLLKWWIEAEMPYTPEEMDHMFRDLALPGVQAIFAGR